MKIRRSLKKQTGGKDLMTSEVRLFQALGDEVRKKLEL